MPPTKAAVETLTAILAKELRGRNITVNAAAPGRLRPSASSTSCPPTPRRPLGPGRSRAGQKLPNARTRSNLRQSVGPQDLDQHATVADPVLAMDSPRAFGIAALDRLDQGEVIGVGGDGLRPQPQGQHADAMRLVPELRDQAAQPTVRAVLEQEAMKALVPLGPAHEIVRLESVLHLHDRVAQGLDLGRRQPAARDLLGR